MNSAPDLPFTPPQTDSDICSLPSIESSDTLFPHLASLETRPNSPAWPAWYTTRELDEFSEKLKEKLEDFSWIQSIRVKKYGEVALEWPIGRTPPEMVKKREAWIRKVLDSSNTPTPYSQFSYEGSPPQPLTQPETCSLPSTELKLVDFDFLETRPDSPGLPAWYTTRELDEFLDQVSEKLDRFIWKQRIRVNKYGEVALEWPIDRTPSELIKEHDAKIFLAPTPEHEFSHIGPGPDFLPVPFTPRTELKRQCLNQSSKKRKRTDDGSSEHENKKTTLRRSARLEAAHVS